MADLAEEEGGWLSVEEMMGQIHKNDQFLVEQSTSQVDTIILIRSGIIPNLNLFHSLQINKIYRK